jgi:hypothetical protein
MPEKKKEDPLNQRPSKNEGDVNFSMFESMQRSSEHREDSLKS